MESYQEDEIREIRKILFSVKENALNGVSSSVPSYKKLEDDKWQTNMIYPINVTSVV